MRVSPVALGLGPSLRHRRRASTVAHAAPRRSYLRIPANGAQNPALVVSKAKRVPRRNDGICFANALVLSTLERLPQSCPDAGERGLAVCDAVRFSSPGGWRMPMGLEAQRAGISVPPESL